MKSVIWFKLPLLLLLLLLTAACSTQQVRYDVRTLDQVMRDMTGQNGRACFQTRYISGYGTIDETVLNVSTKRPEQYVLLMTYSCPSLLTSSAVLFKGAFTELCGGGRDFVSTGSSPCPIRSIYEFENRKAALEAIERAQQTAREIAAREQSTP